MVRAACALAQECVPRGGDQMTWSVPHEGFAGDESLVLNWQGNTYIVVRAGGLVTQIWSQDTTIDPVLLGQRAAARLCYGTTAC
jgi:hypothetical protein